MLLSVSNQVTDIVHLSSHAPGTFESQDLQEIVSRAIRASAREHSVRLLRLEVLDQILPAEFEKLETQQLMARARYKYLTEQRQGLLQELLSTATAYSRDDHYVIFTDLIIRLSEIAGACDQTLSDLSQIADRTSQIQKLIDVHGTSALAIALRKVRLLGVTPLDFCSQMFSSTKVMAPGPPR